MDGLGLTTATTTTTATSCSLATNGLLFPSLSATRLKVRAIRNVSFTRRRKFSVLAAKEDPKLDQWEQMELKFGRLIGEDPKLTLAKIMAKKTNPDASFMEIEKAFYKNKGEIVEIEEVPFDVSNEKKSSSSLDGLNLVRPDPKKGVKFQTEDKPITPEIRKPVQTVKLAVDSSKSSVPNVILRKPNTFSEDVVEDKKGVKFQTDNKPITPEIRKQSQTIKMAVDSSKSSVPNVILRKPNTFNEDVIEDKRPRYRIKPNLSLKLGNEQAKEKFSDMTMLRRPEPMSVNMKDVDKKEEGFGDVEPKVVNDSIGLNMGKSEVEDKFSGFTLSNKPEVTSFQVKVDEKQKMFRDAEANVTEYTEEKGLKAELEATRTANATKTNLETGDSSILNEPELEDDSVIGMQLLEQRNMKSFEEETTVHEPSDTNLVDSNVKYEAALLGKPKRLDKSVKETISSSLEETVPVNLEIYGSSAELKNLPSASPLEEADWSRAEDLVKIGEKEEVELISSSTKGFMVSFGSLIGILPYRNLAAKWKFLAFESWLRQKGLDPSMYKQNLGIIESYDVQNKTSLDSSLDPEIEKKIDGAISPDMKLENLLRIYDQEKLKFLSSLVDQKIKVFVVMADRKSKKLIFSMRPKENEELFVKKRSLMAKLRIGDVVKCCIKKITYFGIFVEVEGVPALIHQSEVSWAATLDTASYFKIGQIVDAKVHQLDFTLGRIFLSLKEIMPDPLIEALESAVGGLDPLDGRLEIAQSDTEWADVESLVKELQQIEGIQSVSKGRFFLSPGLAPTFQVYMASMFENQYKLLARSGNKVQEVIVQASLGKEEMKSTILSCTSRVE